jgi:miniconductance mechanosensitive channel
MISTLQQLLLLQLEHAFTYLPEWAILLLWQSILVLGALLCAYIILKGATLITQSVLVKAIKKSKNTLDDALLENKTLHILPQLFPVAFFFSASPYIFPSEPLMASLTSRLSLLILIMLSIKIISRLLDSAGGVAKIHPLLQNQPITSYIQVLKLLIYIIGIISFIAVILDKNPTVLISGIGALTAVLLLVFKDSILGLVASFQISANDMVRVGDWIEMPQFKADGDVLDVTLTTVKVQNWDKTITTIPSYALVSQSFKNWRGMSESGGRRIKRALNVDINSIAFLTNDDINRLKDITLLRTYLDQKENEIITENHQKIKDVNKRQLSNIGTFRAYIKAYLANHPQIAQNGFTFLIRQLSPSETGLPIEIYVFSKEQNWVKYEDIQSDIFDHLLAIAPVFGIHIFQNPSGRDFQVFTNSLGK